MPPPGTNTGAGAGDAERYRGRPLLAILENYVLDSIGHLSPEKQRASGDIVRRAFGGDLDWKATLRRKLNLSDEVDNVVRTIWRETCAAVEGDAKISPVAFARDFCDQHFASLIDGSVAATGAAAPRASGEAEGVERRNRSIAILRSRGVPTIPELPTIETASEIRLRRPQDVARRAMVLAIMAARAEPGGFSADDARALLAERGVIGDLTPKEREFLMLKEATEEQRAPFTWRYEAVVVLLWALGYIDELGEPDHPCDVMQVARLIASKPASDFIDSARLRDTSQILDEADLIYRYDWAVVDARVNHRRPPRRTDPGVVYERHYALNWLIGYARQSWDQITTDT